MHEETKFMLRVPAFGVGAEVEVLPYVTLMGQGDFVIHPNYSYTYFLLSANARWYYSSKKKGVRNMSGNYIAIGTNADSYNPLQTEKFSKLRLYARWGVQRRFLGAGLIDLGLNLGYEKHYSNVAGNTYVSEQVFLKSTGTIGLGLVFNNEKDLDKDKLCPVLKCYERETFLLKINTMNLLSLEYADFFNRSIVLLTPQVSLEQKLFNSPFSIGANFKLQYEWVHTDNADFYYNQTYLTYFARINTRYYYNLKSRILKGKSGNGFSANYFSVGLMKFNEQEYEPNLKIEKNSITLTTGIQRTFSEHFYFDLEIGGAIDLESARHSSFFGDVQVGIKF